MMNRRTFMLATAAGALLPARLGAAAPSIATAPATDWGVSTRKTDRLDGLASLSLEELRDFHHAELRERYLPVWQSERVDWQNGGFMHQYDPGDGFGVHEPGEPHTNKSTYYQGRGLWMFSHLYNHFGRDPKHLEAARKGKEFLFRHLLRPDDTFVEETTREGEVIHEKANIYGDIYIAMGLAEYYKASGDEQARDQSLRTALTVFERAASPTYQHDYHEHGSKIPGIQRLGTWQHFLNALTTILRIVPDERVEAAATVAAEKILHFHYDPMKRVGWENLPFDGTPAEDERETGRVSNWHAVQSAWMAMDEGLRRGDRLMFVEGLEMGRSFAQSVLARTRTGVGGHTDDLLIYLLMAIEHTQRSEYIELFDQTWQAGVADPKWRRTCLLHHPRRLFLSIEILDRMIAREGRVSGFLFA